MQGRPESDPKEILRCAQDDTQRLGMTRHTQKEDHWLYERLVWQDD